MLQVTWDEPEVLQNAIWVSPWQVDFVASTPSLHAVSSLHTVFPPTKRLRAPLNPGLLRNGEEEFMIPMTGAGSQARSILCIQSHLLNENTPRMCTYNSFGNNMVPKLKRVSTELNIGSPQSDQLSPDSQSSPHSFVMELDGNRNCNSPKVGRSSFQLFGVTIELGGTDALGDGGKIRYNDTELLNGPLDLSHQTA